MSGDLEGMTVCQQPIDFHVQPIFRCLSGSPLLSGLQPESAIAQFRMADFPPIQLVPNDAGLGIDPDGCWKARPWGRATM